MRIGPPGSPKSDSGWLKGEMGRKGVLDKGGAEQGRNKVRTREQSVRELRIIDSVTNTSRHCHSIDGLRQGRGDLDCGCCLH